MLAIAPVVPSTLPLIPDTLLTVSTLTMVVGVLALTVTLFFLILNIIYRRLYQSRVSFEKVILLVTVPKYKAEKEEKPDTIESIREQIAVAESLFAIIGGLKAEKGLRAMFWGRQDHLSLEIVHDKGLISFYVVSPKYLHDHLEQNIHAQYPSASVDEVADYNIFLPKGVTRGAVLKFSRPYFYPIKTYRETESDPLNAITNVMSKLDKNGASIQFVIRSAKHRWHKHGRRFATELHQGKTMTEATRRSHPNFLVRTWGEIVKGVKAKPQPKDAQTEQNRPRQMSAMEQEMAKRVEEKASKAGVEANIRVVVSSPTMEEADRSLNNLLNSFTQYNMYQYGNTFFSARPKNQERFLYDFIYRHFRRGLSVVLNTEELTSLFHFPLPSTETPNIRWMRAKKAPPPETLSLEGITLGKNVYRGETKIIKFAEEDRRRHCYIIGTTGSGKSVLMGEMAKQDIADGKGVCIVDPHGSLVDDILESIPKKRAEDVIYFDPSDVERPIGLNMLEARTPAEMDFVTQEMIAIFYKLVTDPSMIGPMFEHNMRNAMLTLMADKEFPGTITEIPRIFTDQEFQKYKVAKVKDPMVKAFWEQEMAKTSDFHKSEMLGYLISKVGRFVENAMMRNIIGQPVSGFDVREIMDNKKILLVNLSKGKVGEINSNLLGLIIVSKLQMAALARADDPSGNFPDFYLYIDEFQNFITDSIATILSEARKYKLDLTMAHQYIGQLSQGQDTSIRDAVLGNVGTMVCFRIGVEDAEIMAKQFEPVFNQYDLVNIDKYRAYIRLLINNTVGRPFDIDSLPPTIGDPRRAALLKKYSRLKFGRDRAVVEAEILERSRLGIDAQTAKLSDAALNR